MTKDRNTGGSFDAFLEEEGIPEEVEAVAIKRVIAWEIKQATADRKVFDMGVKLDEMMSHLPVERLLKVEARARTLIAEEMSLRDDET